MKIYVDEKDEQSIRKLTAACNVGLKLKLSASPSPAQCRADRGTSVGDDDSMVSCFSGSYSPSGSFTSSASPSPACDEFYSTNKILMAYRLRSADSARVMDILFWAIQNSKLSLEEIDCQLNYLAPFASTVGLSVEETIGSMVVLSDSGMEADQFGTAFRNVLIQFGFYQRISGPLLKILEDNKIDPKEVDSSVAGYQSVLKTLLLVIGNQKTGEDVVNSYKFFGVYGCPAAIVLLRAFESGKLQRVIESLNTI
jgi:TP901 family phage tail tape measure protein